MLNDYFWTDYFYNMISKLVLKVSICLWKKYVVCSTWALATFFVKLIDVILLCVGIIFLKVQKTTAIVHSIDTDGGDYIHVTSINVFSFSAYMFLMINTVLMFVGKLCAIAVSEFVMFWNQFLLPSFPSHFPNLTGPASWVSPNSDASVGLSWNGMS